MATVVNAELVAESPVSVPVEKMPIVYPVTDVAISKIREQCTGLTCDTKDGYKQVKVAIAGTRKLRVEVEKKRKALKEDALKYGRAVDAEAKRITKLLEDIETPLQAMKDAADEKAERERQEAELAERRKLEAELAEQQRIQREAEEARLKAEREAAEAQLEAQREALEHQQAEQARIEAEQAAERERLQAERDRLAAEQAESDRIAREAEERIAAQQRELEQRRQQLEREESERQARIKAEQEAKERAEREAREAAERAKRERIEAAERAERERLEAERLAAEQEERERKAAELAEAMKPDVEKIHALAGKLRAIKLPAMTTEPTSKFIVAIGLQLQQLATDCEQF